MSNPKKRIITLILGLLCIFIALILNNYQIIRFLLYLLGLILLTISNAIERSNAKLFVPLFDIIFFFLLVATDYLCVSAFKKVPILAYNIVTNDESTVYNAIGYRVWVCKTGDKLFKVDPLYKLGYYCSSSNMQEEDINNILPIINNSFNSYQDSYVKIVGKITKIVDEQTLNMSTYTINVNFNIASKDIISHNKNDSIIIYGKIDSRTTDDNKVIIRMIDSSIITTNDDIQASDTSGYNFKVENNNYCQYDKELWFQTTDKIIYKACLNDLSLTIFGSEY